MIKELSNKWVEIHPTNWVNGKAIIKTSFIRRFEEGSGRNGDYKPWYGVSCMGTSADVFLISKEEYDQLIELTIG